MAPAHITVCLSQKPSTKNGIIRPSIFLSVVVRAKGEGRATSLTSMRQSHNTRFVHSRLTTVLGMPLWSSEALVVRRISAGLGWHPQYFQSLNPKQTKNRHCIFHYKS